MMVSLLFAASAVLAQTAAASGVVAEPQDYRMSDYRAPVPATLKGATVLDAASLHALIANDGAMDVALIDVLPRDRKPPDFPADRLWRPPTRHNLPGSVWLPNVGYGRISDARERYFMDNLEMLTTHREGRILVFYCDANCWMSWNAAKRAIEYGFRNVHWFPGGVDEWKEAGHELAAGKPVKMPPEFPELTEEQP